MRRWQGVVLCTAALVSTVWLAVTGQLILYIHPRYIVFTVIMAALGLALVIAGLVARPDHDHDEPPRRWGAVVSVIATVLTLGVAVGLVVVPPATLTTATADQRVINSTNVGAATKTVGSAASAPSGASSKFTVLDWSSLLRQTSDVNFYRDKTADVTGFVTADKDDPDNVFYVSRFVITCCAVDAQPVGVPVYLPNWKNGFKADGWVRVTGEFDTNPSSRSRQPIALVPTATTAVSQPRDPYLY
ncbi:MAG TPA: TIGR03943 family protein [Lacisediminihabitans sp.]|uniref:TIGR03943 family putative permease subunit n=1 Tax=Lacisediminihabitans sp. TaxID=2787631 RepID=UPI002ED8C7A8